MTDRVLLVGLDFGTTTSFAPVASAAVACNSLSGRVELTDIRQEYQSDQVFTPLVDDRLDETKLGAYLDVWLKAVDPRRVLGGGAVITGLSAQRDNAAALAALVRARQGCSNCRRRRSGPRIVAGLDWQLRCAVASPSGSNDREPRHWRRHDEPGRRPKRRSRQHRQPVRRRVMCNSCQAATRSCGSRRMLAVCSINWRFANSLAINYPSKRYWRSSNGMPACSKTSCVARSKAERSGPRKS